MLPGFFFLLIVKCVIKKETEGRNIKQKEPGPDSVGNSEPLWRAKDAEIKKKLLSMPEMADKVRG